jgi:hypothetical protein
MAGAFEDDLVWADTVDEGVDWVLSGSVTD